MLHFESDYIQGTHPKILEELIKTNLDQTTGYGVDPYCLDAKEKIKQACENEEIDIHFMVGGTQVNLTVIDAILRPYQGVVAANSAHINTHETGAIEACGHRIITLEENEGKISAQQVESLYIAHLNDETKEHTVEPGMVFISNPTEYGTIYTKEELTALSDVCKKYHLPLYLDGARLGYGMVCPTNNLTMNDLTNLCDVFYIGGTKVGALFGEAVVIVNASINHNFRYMMKQKGGLLAKGRLLGIQFQTLFNDDLYFNISKNAINQAQKIQIDLLNKGYSFYYDSPTNQLFPILSKQEADQLSKKVVFTKWAPIGENQVIRLCTSWATTDEDVEQLLQLIPNR